MGLVCHQSDFGDENETELTGGIAQLLFETQPTFAILMNPDCADVVHPRLKLPLCAVMLGNMDSVPALSRRADRLR